MRVRMSLTFQSILETFLMIYYFHLGPIPDLEVAIIPRDVAFSTEHGLIWPAYPIVLCFNPGACLGSLGRGVYAKPLGLTSGLRVRLVRRSVRIFRSLH